MDQDIFLFKQLFFVAHIKNEKKEQGMCAATKMMKRTNNKIKSNLILGIFNN